MEIKVLDNAGFCFGVNNAMETVYKLLNEKKKVCTLGEIIHNKQVVNEIEKAGVSVIHSFLEANEDETIVIRSHGIDQNILNDIKKSGRNFVDTTCPFVKKIHHIVERESNNKKFLLIAGDQSHPEVIGIRSYFLGESYVFSDQQNLRDILYLKKDLFKQHGAVMVSQTTFSTKKWNECKKIISKSFTNFKIYDTICNITNLRQEGTEKLAKVSDLMIVIGGKQSSNTKKLYELCSNYTHTIWIEKLEDMFELNLVKFKKIGITAGASTPKSIILQVKNYLESFLQYN